MAKRLGDSRTPDGFTGTANQSASAGSNDEAKRRSIGYACRFESRVAAFLARLTAAKRVPSRRGNNEERDRLRGDSGWQGDVYEFRHPAAASALRCLTWQLPWRKTGAVPFLRPPDRMAVAAERCIEYTALSTGCRALPAFLTAFGVTARFTARPGCIARRTLRGTNNLEKNPTGTSWVQYCLCFADYAFPQARCCGDAQITQLCTRSDRDSTN
jgi:hypothetical protein